MTFDQIIKDIKAKKYSPVYFLTGDEPYYIDQVAELIENSVLNEGEKAFNQVIAYGKDTEFKTIVDEARQFPMMSPYRVIILKEAQDMRTLPELESYIANPAPSSILVICYKYKKLDKRLKFAKTVVSKSIFLETKKLYDNQLPGWIQDYLAKIGYKASPNVVALLANYIGSDLSRLTNEITKLILNVPKGSMITEDQVREFIGISKDFDVFEFQKAIGERDFKKATLIMQYFIHNPASNPIPMIIGSLYNYFNKIYMAAYHSALSNAELAKILGVVPIFVQEYRNAAKNYPIAQLQRVMQALKIADEQSKGIGSGRSRDGAVLKDFLIACMGSNISQ